MTEATRRKRGAALLAAIAVLAILTILVGGLAMSQTQARDSNLRWNLKQDLQNAARACEDEALARLAAGEAAGFEGKLAFEMAAPLAGKRGPKARAEYRVKSTEEANPIYGQSGFLAYRPGDALLEVTTRGRRARQVWEMRQTYLVNAGADSRRRVRLSQSFSKGIEGGSER